jgi:hypothetical protein
MITSDLEIQYLKDKRKTGETAFYQHVKASSEYGLSKPIIDCIHLDPALTVA